MKGLINIFDMCCKYSYDIHVMSMGIMVMTMSLYLQKTSDAIHSGISFVLIKLSRTEVKELISNRQPCFLKTSSVVVVH